MPQVSTLITGAGVPTVLAGQSQLEMCCYLGDIDTPCPLSGIQVTVDGKAKIDVQGSQPLVSVLMKLMQEISVNTIGTLFKFCVGRITNNTTYRFINNGATTPIIALYSTETADDASAAIEATTVGINPLSNDSFSDFSYLAISPSANVASVDVVFADGTAQNMSVLDLDALFATANPTEANGRLDAIVTTLDNRDRKFKGVKINATTALTVMKVYLDQMYFERNKNAA